jgi:hypothetical protein
MAIAASKVYTGGIHMARQISPSRPLLFAALAALAVSFALPQVCLACTCAPEESPLEAAADADAVFRAQAIEVQRPNGPEGIPDQRALLRVTDLFFFYFTAYT